MKSVLALTFAGLAAVATAQSTSDLPSCAAGCLTSGLSNTGCSLTDIACACSNQQFVDDSTTCIKGACSASDQQKALAAAEALCQSAGVTISVPASATATGAPASSAPASSAAATSAPAETSAPATTAAPSTAVTSAASTLVTSAVVSSSAAAPVSSASPVATVPSNGTNTTVTPPVATQPEGSGSSRLAACFSLLGLGLLTAMAF